MKYKLKAFNRLIEYLRKEFEFKNIFYNTCEIPVDEMFCFKERPPYFGLIDAQVYYQPFSWLKRITSWHRNGAISLTSGFKTTSSNIEEIVRNALKQEFDQYPISNLQSIVNESLSKTGEWRDVITNLKNLCKPEKKKKTKKVEVSILI